jgi:hypothetical protein
MSNELIREDDSQQETKCIDEENPSPKGNSEYSWHLNRRVDICYLKESY